MPSLADHYRRLLLCYPRAYRRERGEEIVDTLVELAPPGRSRPTAREAVNLVRHGLRCRLGRPASRAVVVWAVLATVVWALFSAAFASRAAWETARPLPHKAEASAIFASALPGYPLTEPVDRSPAMFVIYGHPLSRGAVHSLLFGDGGEYQFGSTSTYLNGLSPVDLRHAVEVAAQRLAGSGWQVSGPVSHELDVCGGTTCDVTDQPTEITLSAKRGADIIELEADYGGGFVQTQLNIAVERATPWAVYPASLAGGVLGAVATWLVFGWASRRTEARHPALRALTVLLLGLAVFLWWLPIPLAATSLLAHQRSEHHFRWHPLWEWLGQPTASLLFLVGCGAALAGLGLAALPRRRPGLATDVATR